MTAQEKLRRRITGGYHICVGLDSDIKKLPGHLLNGENPILEFNKHIIECITPAPLVFLIKGITSDKTNNPKAI